MEQLKFRKLRADEIELRICKINRGGVELLMYKDARCDQNILDEQIGPMNWQRHHTNNNANCIVAIWDESKGQWIEKEDAGFAESDNNAMKLKGIASDSFKRACFNWGIGRELYTAPNLFIPKEKLKNYKEGESLKCYDEFKVQEIEYDESRITAVKIAICEYGRKYDEITFTNKTLENNTSTENPVQKNIVVKDASTTASNTVESASGDAEQIHDDTVIRIGNCRGQKYGDVKNSETFKKFLTWIRTASPQSRYENPAQIAQFNAFKKMAMGC